MSLPRRKSSSLNRNAAVRHQNAFYGAGLSGAKGLAGAARAADVAVMATMGVVAYMIRHEQFAFPGLYVIAVALGVLFHQIVAGPFGAYRFDHPAPVPSQAVGIFLAVSTAMLLLALAAYFTKLSDQFSRVWAGAWWLCSLIGMALGRGALLAAARRGFIASGRPPRAVVVGSATRTAALRCRLEAGSFTAVHVVGEMTIEDVVALPERLKTLNAEEVIIAGPLDAPDEAERLLWALKASSARCRYVLEPPFDALPAPRIANIGGAAAIELLPAPINGGPALLKRAEDVLLTLALLIVAIPTMAAAALAIRLEDGGPAVFRQRRRGYRGEVITVFKLRTMTQDAAQDCAAPQATRDDRRVTKVGRVLRRWSIDELPQLFNVLRGDMSLVGPRPLALPHDAQFAAMIEGYAARRRMKPGLTGWAQANGLRGEVRDMAALEERVRRDLEYVEHWSPAFDCWILLLTMLRLFNDRNAY